jgi:hypothetical protein
MTTNAATTDVSMTDKPELSEDEIEAMRRADVLLDPEHERAAPDQYGRQSQTSAIHRHVGPQPPSRQV